LKRVAIALTGWPLRVKEMVRAVQYAEQCNYEMIWSAEDYFTGRDGITPLACFALSTKKVKLGTCVINPYTRTPGMIAVTMSTLDELSEGRMILGLGAGLGWAPIFEGTLKEMKSIKKMRKCIELNRRLFSEKTVNYYGKSISIQSDPYWWPKGVVRPVRESIPIYLGSRGPKMIKLTAEKADGMIIELGASVPVVRQRIRKLIECCEQIGRDPKELDIVCLITVSASENGLIDETTLRFTASRIIRIDDKIYPVKLSGVDKTEIEKVKKAYKKGGLNEATKYVSDNSIHNFMAHGTPEKCIRKIQDYVNVGVDLPTIFSIGEDIKLAIKMGEKYAKNS
jgi:5,10-methylenetetrahydromethanopterin reductase